MLKLSLTSLNLLIIVVSFMGLSACETPVQEPNTKATDYIPGSGTSTDDQNTDTFEANTNFEAVKGFRFVVLGDFNGDGLMDTLKEHYMSLLGGQEIPKFYLDMDFDALVDTTCKKEPYCFLLDGRHNLDTLSITKSCQQFGLSFLKNEGDLDGDGADELSYVIHYADWSNLNTWHVVSYKSGDWKELLSFKMWDWQVPDLPGTWNQYGVMGLSEKVIIIDDSLNQMIRDHFNNFPGLLTKSDNGLIKIRFMNEEAMEDSAIFSINSIPAKFRPN